MIADQSPRVKGHCWRCLRRFSSKNKLHQHLDHHPSHRIDYEDTVCCGNKFYVANSKGVKSLLFHLLNVKPSHVPAGNVCCGSDYHSSARLVKHLCNDKPRHSFPYSNNVVKYWLENKNDDKNYDPEYEYDVDDLLILESAKKEHHAGVSWIHARQLYNVVSDALYCGNNSKSADTKISLNYNIVTKLPSLEISIEKSKTHPNNDSHNTTKNSVKGCDISLNVGTDAIDKLQSYKPCNLATSQSDQPIDYANLAKSAVDAVKGLSDDSDDDSDDEDTPKAQDMSVPDEDSSESESVEEYVPTEIYIEDSSDETEVENLDYSPRDEDDDSEEEEVYTVEDEDNSSNSTQYSNEDSNDTNSESLESYSDQDRYNSSSSSESEDDEEKQKHSQEELITYHADVPMMLQSF